MGIDANSMKGRGPLIISIIAISLLMVTVISLFWNPFLIKEEPTEIIDEADAADDVEKNIDYYYGIGSDSVRAESNTVLYGATLASILNPYSVTATDIHNMVENSKTIFDVRSMKKGGIYTLLFDKKTDKLRHFIYDINPIEYIIYTFDTTITAQKVKREVVSHRKTLFLTVTSSLWESIVTAGGSAAMVASIDDIFQWTIDFYGIMPGDSFSILFDENYVEGKSIGIGEIIAISYIPTNGSRKYALRYERDGRASYWDEEGMSLKRAFLKAPLRYSRISSKFTYRRLHPISKIYKAHTGVDYAAPIGTPVQSIADGVVTHKFYNAGGGNTLKIKHNVQNGTYQSGYLHLSKYAAGVNIGSRVSQGQIIAYVGSTGGSTGPHLDFRIWKKGIPIDPLKLNYENGEPLAGVELIQYKESIVEHMTSINAVSERGLKALAEGKEKGIDELRKEYEQGELQYFDLQKELDS